MRLIDIDELQGCAIIMPTTHEEMSHILACKCLVKHDDIPTAYDVDKVIEEIHNQLFCYDIPDDLLDEIVKNGGVNK